MADGYAHYPRSSPQPAQTVPSVSRRDASLEVQRQLRNEQGDNLEEYDFYSFFLFCTLKSWQPVYNLQCRAGASACHCLF